MEYCPYNILDCKIHKDSGEIKIYSEQEASGIIR